MKIEVENLEGHNKKITIEIPSIKVNEEFDNYYRHVQKSVELKGFRKGKAPMEMVKKLYGDSASSQVTQRLVEDNLRNALREHQLSPISMPQIDTHALMYDVDFKFTATFEASPPVDLKNYTNFKLEKSPITIEKEEIEKTLGNIQNQMATFDTLSDATLENGLFAVLDYVAQEAGIEVPEATEKDASFEIGAGVLFADFEKNVIGLKTGDKKDFTIKFPNPEKPEERTPVSGRTLDFSVTVKEVRKRKLPELSDEFATKIGPFKSLSELKERVEQDLKNQKETNLLRDLQEKAIDLLIQDNPVDASETLVSQQMEQLAIDAGMQLSQMGLDEKAIEERLKSWGDEMLSRATRQIKASLLLGAISKKENIQATDEDLRKEITRIAVQSKRNPKDVLEDLQKRSLINGLVRQVTELKALDWVVAKATGQNA